MRIIGGPSRPNIRGWSGDQNLSLRATPRQEAPVSSLEVTLQDAVYRRAVYEGPTHMFDVVVSPSSKCPAGHVLVSETPDVCYLDGHQARYVGPGTAVITARYCGGTVTLLQKISGPSVVDEYLRWSPGSLARHVFDAVSGMLAGKSPSDANQLLYSTITGGRDVPPAASMAIRNATNFATVAGYDLSPISTFRAGEPAGQYPVILVTPQHIWAHHVRSDNGQEIHFVDLQGNRHARTVVGSRAYSQEWGVHKLNAPITAFPPMKVAPANLDSFLPSLTGMGRQLPMLQSGFNFGGHSPGGRLGLQGLRKVQPLAGATFGISADFPAWSWAIANGDSNGPGMLPVNGELVLVSMTLRSTFGHTPWTPTSEGAGNVLRDVQGWIDDLGSEGYQLTSADLSAFPSYP